MCLSQASLTLSAWLVKMAGTFISQAIAMHVNNNKSFIIIYTEKTISDFNKKTLV